MVKKEDFPMEAVNHLARSNCHCQTCRKDVDENRHWECCWVGKAQAYLGRIVKIKPLWEDEDEQ